MFHAQTSLVAWRATIQRISERATLQNLITSPASTSSAQPQLSDPRRPSFDAEVGELAILPPHPPSPSCSLENQHMSGPSLASQCPNPCSDLAAEEVQAAGSHAYALWVGWVSLIDQLQGPCDLPNCAKRVSSMPVSMVFNQISLTSCVLPYTGCPLGAIAILAVFGPGPA